MTLRELQAFMECPKKIETGRLSASEENRYRYWKEAVRCMCGMLEERRPISQIKERVFLLFQRSYQTVRFLLPWQKESAVAEDAAYFARYLEMFPYDQISGIKSNRRIRLETNREFNGRHVNNIWFCVHLILTYKDGRHEAVIFERQFKRNYSSRAKLKAHMPESAPELSAMLYALRDLSNLKVSLVQLRSGNDERCLAKVFLLAADVNWSAKQTYEHFLSGISMTPKSECTKCQYEPFCRRPQKSYLPQQKEKQYSESEPYSEEQKRIIGWRDGNIRVSAGPGSGKTMVIVRRAEELARSGTSAGKILVLTYTREAAKELSSRIREKKGVLVCTIHSLAYQILLRYADITGKKRLADQMDKKLLLLYVLKHAPKLSGMSYDGIGEKYGLLEMLLKYFAFIEQHGEAKFRETHWEKDVDGILRIKRFFDAAFQSRKYITYEEQISEAVNLLLENPSVLKREQERYQYLLIDEAQDLDREQVNFIRLLSAGQNNLMLVGDDDQSIFGFRGGSNDFLLHFKESYPDAAEMTLSSNYRSSLEIVEASNALISNNQARLPKKMNSKRGRSGIPCIHMEHFSDAQLPVLLCEMRKRLGCEWQDIAVVSRNNKELYKLCKILEAYSRDNSPERKIPFAEPKYYLEKDAAFCALYDLLTLSVKGMEQDRALYRLLVTLGVEGLEKYEKGKSLYQDLLDRGLIYSMEKEDLSYYAVTKADTSLMQSFSKIYKAKTALFLPGLQRALRLAAGMLFTDQNMDSEPALAEIDDLVQEKRIRTIPELQKMLELMEMLGEGTRIHYPNGNNGVRFLTAHDAKGQQFPAVFLYAIDLFETGNEEEDRRLLYVAMTRAQNCLVTSELIKGKSNFLRDFVDYVKVWR